jgi:hypothetical protein
MVTAVSVLGLLLLFLIPALTHLRLTGTDIQHKAYALREVRNIVEKLQSSNSSEFPPLGDAVKRYLPEAQGVILSESIAADGAAPAQTRLTAVLSWKEPSGTRSVRLSWWKVSSTDGELP